jgi:DNA-binding winged helix-turn-helix (wHTH) protein
MEPRYIEISSAGRCYRLDLRAKELHREREQRIPLRPKEWDLLRFLIEQNEESPRQVVTREKLEARVWNGQSRGNGTIDRTVNALRDALGDKRKSASFIETAYRDGYRFIAEVKHLHSDPADLINPETTEARDRAEAAPVQSSGAKAREPRFDEIIIREFDPVARNRQRSPIDKNTRVFFNNGWDGFSTETDDDVICYLSLNAPTDLISHISILREYITDVYLASERGIAVRPDLVDDPFEDDALLTIVFLSISDAQKQTDANYHYYFKAYDPVVPEAVYIDALQGNEQAMWSWCTKLPRSWFEAENVVRRMLRKPKDLTQSGKDQLRRVVDSWTLAHNTEMARIGRGFADDVEDEKSK